MYDARLSDLGAAIDCGLIALTEVPALASNTLTFSSSYLKDERNLVDLKKASTLCQQVYKEAFELEDPFYTAYSFHTASMPIADTTLCDLSSKSNASCIMQTILRSEKPIIQSMESVPGVEVKDIWLNVAAIVGGVQFFAWAVQALVDVMRK